MAKNKAAPLNASLLVRKGEAAPSSSESNASSAPEAPVPRERKIRWL